MSHSDYRTLVDRGRKAGLRTSELYRALTTRPPDRQETNGSTDTNGFVAAYDDKGHRIYRPSNSRQ